MTVRTDEELLALADQIRDEVTAGANTAARVGQMLRDIVESKSGAAAAVALTDTNLTLLVTTARSYRMAPGTQTAARQMILGATGAKKGDSITIINQDGGAFQLIIQDEASGGTDVLAAGVDLATEYVFDGAFWGVLRRYVPN